MHATIASALVVAIQHLKVQSGLVLVAVKFME
jgi:hypothetical protein